MPKILKSGARDLVALGGVPFYLIIMARATIGNYNLFLYQLLAAGITIQLLGFLVKKSNLHIARGMAIVAFTTLFYMDFGFSMFATIIWIASIPALMYIKTKPKAIAKGIAIGAVSSAAAYYLV